MRNSNEQSIAEVIQKMLNAYHLKDGLNTVAITNLWEKLMGNAIQHRTTSINLKNKVLNISVDSAVLRQELQFKREEIKIALNAELNDEVISEVVIR